MTPRSSEHVASPSDRNYLCEKISPPSPLEVQSRKKRPHGRVQRATGMACCFMSSCSLRCRFSSSMLGPLPDRGGRPHPAATVMPALPLRDGEKRKLAHRVHTLPRQAIRSFPGSGGASAAEGEEGSSDAKGSGTTARGRRLLRVREEKRKREYDRIHNYPTWAKSAPFSRFYFYFSCVCRSFHL